MNYNNWFYEQHKYLTGVRDNNITYNDTKWVDIVQRYRTLIDMGSELLNEQPFGVVGNNTGFDKLIDLMSRSNYTFEDINESLIDTYRVSLKNAMSRMVVNTHDVMFRCNNMDKNMVAMDKFTHYYIVDVPFNQLHFGDRDEFIRQKLHKMHNTESGHYVPITEFVTSEITSLLGFSILCTVNGFICNDCQVALDDKGFKFKIGWLYSKDVEFIIYKLDESLVYTCQLDASLITSKRTIPYSSLGNLINERNVEGLRCVVNIYDKNFIKTVPSVPNFGVFDNKGLTISNIQQKTIDDIRNNKSKSLTVVIYAFRYLHELPNVYPAVNYYDIMDSRRVFTNKENKVSNVEGNRILSNSTNNTNKLEVCTPPIVLDRPINLSFETILNCLDMYDTLMKYESMFKNIGTIFQQNSSSMDFKTYQEKVRIPLSELYDNLNECYMNYTKGAILTSLVPSASTNKFHDLMDKLNILKSCTILQQVQQKEIPDEFYGDNYKIFVLSITAPFRNKALSNFTNLSDLSKNYFTDSNYQRFNRPVSEQCFITLKYRKDEGCWLFDLPSIKHFKGIGNTFYIDDDLEGDEVFKFFVLYTDTESVIEKEVPSLDMNDILDFDTFCEEVNKHEGYIRYWDTENKLMKICKVIYDKYDGETCVQVLSKILKRKIDGEDIIDIYPSEINYEPSNITSDNVGAGEYDDRGPFSINFLFYTLSMLYDNEDKLQTYFFRHLTDNKFNNRYSDINIDEVVNDSIKYPVNYSQISISPNIIDSQSSVLPISGTGLSFYGLPLIVNSSGAVTITTPYRYTFNVYNSDTKHHLIVDNDINTEYYVKYSDPSQYGSRVNVYHDDIYIGKMMTFYLTYLYGYISRLQTNYTITYNQTALIDSGIETIQTQINKLNDYMSKEGLVFDTSSNTEDIVNSVVIMNPFITRMNQMKNYIKTINKCAYNGKNISTVDFFNSLISTLQQVYVTIGFDNFALKRARMLYIHSKKINTSMSIYQYRKWLNDFDLDMLQKLDHVIANNENYDLADNVFTQFYNSLVAYKSKALPILDSLEESVKDLGLSLFEEHINPIIEYVDKIVNNYIFDMYVLRKIEYDSSLTFDKRPHILTMTLSSNEHTCPPAGITLFGDATLIFQPVTDFIDGKYVITSISKICEYAFFSNKDINECTMNILDEDGNVVKTTTVSLSFARIGSSADMVNEFDQLPNIHNIVIDIENIHESFEVTDEGLIVNKKHADMNYEMLIGNHFDQLNHESELVLNPKTMIPGSVDRIHISNQKINDFINFDYGTHVSKRMFFKPTQVLHLSNNEDGSVSSVGGKYFVGQHLYLSTDDGLSVFPVIVTAVDHSVNHGFVEAVVDEYNAKWFTVDDGSLISKYLTSPIECHVIDDNIRNFLDEFSDSSYKTYSNVLFNMNLDPSDEVFTDAYSLPGDPIFVNNNTEFVYTRLNWFFNELVPNRFIDEEHKRHKFIYIGDGFINNQDDTIKIKMINHDFNTMTNPEMYPVLREEPNDHEIWDKEIEVFKRYKYSSEMSIANHERNIGMLYDRLNRATKDSDREKIMNMIESAKCQRDYEYEFQQRMVSYIEQQESPTTWYNVRAYEDTLVYISNGRAYRSPTFMSNIRDIPYNENLNVFIYDWENKHWLDPSTYSIQTQVVNSVKIDELDDYTTNNVLYSITITPNENFTPSKKLLVYFSYDTSDVFDNIPMNEYKCNVRFKPILSLDNIRNSFNPYENIKIRKHFDANETYVFNEYNAPDNFSIKESFYLTRPKRSGKYTNSSKIHLCDMSVVNGENVYDFTNFDMYVKVPFLDVSTKRTFKVPVYDVKINQPIDSFEPNVKIRMICIQNNDTSSYDGNISNIMFEGFTSYDEESDTSSITITNSTLSNIVSGKFICTVFQDDSYKMSGGVITVEVSFAESELMDNNGAWMKIPTSLATYREIPNECILVPKENVTLNMSPNTVPLDTTDVVYKDPTNPNGDTLKIDQDGVYNITEEKIVNGKKYGKLESGIGWVKLTPIKVIFKNLYIKDTNDSMSIDNSSTFNPFEYYFDSDNDIRLPISDVRRNKNDERLIVDKTLNPGIKLIKSNYIGICRYALQKIPENGFIDFTGYIPTPLSRTRYEFWVNGRNINNKTDVIILSPTSIQLCNMTSLRNFELIELVDDVKDSGIIQEGNVYVDLNGNTFSSYGLAMFSNHNITKQNIRFMYNANQHQKIHDYTTGIITNPNNHNIEPDILNGISVDVSTVTDYNKLYNIPSINGITLFHPKVSSLGIVDIPNDEIIKVFDDVWKFERLTNPLFDKTHRTDLSLIDNQYLELKIRNSIDSSSISINTSDSFIVYTTGTTSKYFSLYISKKSNGKIDDVENTLKIIPFIKTGVYVLIDKSYEGMWLHSTMKNCKPIKIK